jgi:hypothetical protein
MPLDLVLETVCGLKLLVHEASSYYFERP